MKHLLSEASEEEKQVVKDWVNANEANGTYYKQLVKVWESSKELSVISDVDENKAWERFKNRINNSGSSGQITRHNRFSWMRVAASVILLSGLGIAAYFLMNKNSGSKEMLVQTVQNVLIDTLSDGSVVTLNKKSSLAYSAKFKGDTRAVALKGEAFFNVAPDKKKPFIITVNDLLVTVKGTSFNVKDEAGNTEIVVETGVVQVTRSGKTVELVAGEKLKISASDTELKKENVSDKLYNYYRSKEFVCDDTPLWKLVEVLNRAYDANIVVGRKELNELKLNTTFINESLDNVLEIIHLTFEIDIIKKDGKIILQ